MEPYEFPFSQKFTVYIVCCLMHENSCFIYFFQFYISIERLNLVPINSVTAGPKLVIIFNMQIHCVLRETYDSGLCLCTSCYHPQ